MARPRFRFGLARAPHEPPTSGGYRGALVRLQARDGSRTSDNEPYLAITAAQAGLAFCSEPSRAKRVPSRASASITCCVRKRLLRLRDKTAPLTRPSPPPTYAMVPSLRSGILIAPPARCIHRPQRNASSADTSPRLATCLTAHPTNRVVACRSVRRSTPRPLPHLP